MASLASQTNTGPHHAQQRPKLHILVAAAPIIGHFEIMRAIAADLVTRGFKVSFLTASCFRSRVEPTGCCFVSLDGVADIDWDHHEQVAPAMNHQALYERFSSSPWEGVNYGLVTFFIAQMVSQFGSVQKFLAEAYSSYPEELVVMLQDSFFMGALPPLLGAPGLRPAGLISMGIFPLMFSSIDTAPFNMALPPDSSEEGRRRNAILNEEAHTVIYGPSQEAFVTELKEVGATDTSLFVLDALCLKPDLFLQLSIPQLEYPRSDSPKTLRFIGALPPGQREAMPLPNWWDEIVRHEKKLVVVTQGTVANDPSELILPTITALASRVDVTVVTTLVRGETIANFTPPTNVRIAKWIPFDQLFKYTDCVVSNGGFGTIQQALVVGVPLVLAGGTEEKPEGCARTAWSGAAIDLRKARPEVEELRDAVEHVLFDVEQKVKKRAVELKAEYARYDCLGSIASAIEELALKS